MKNKLKIGDYTIVYNMTQLKKDAKLFFWSEELEEMESEEYSISKEEFEKQKTKFLAAIDKLPETIEKLFKKNITLTSKNKLDKRKNNEILISNFITSYDDSYGSHSYTVPCLILEEINDKTVEIFCTEVTKQSPF